MNDKHKVTSWRKTKDERKTMKVRCAMPVNMDARSHDYEWQGWENTTLNAKLWRDDGSERLNVNDDSERLNVDDGFERLNVDDGSKRLNCG